MGISDEQSLWKPAPDRFSLAEVLEHLAHVEGHYFRRTLDQILATDNPAVEGYDEKAFAAEGAYSDRDAEDSFAHWEEQREDNIVALRALESITLSRKGTHVEVGEFTLAHLLNEWALHDLGHVRQIAELVRAKLYYPEIGPFAGQYQLRP